jgi:precorrin-2 dehydrogenase / sirohydrochlorin ferrochelatase
VGVDPMYPAFLRVSGRKCLVVGGGTVAARKVRKLAESGAVIAIVSPFIHEDIRNCLGPTITWSQRTYQSSDIEGTWLVVAATNEPAVNEQVRKDATAALRFVNVVDDGDACTYMVPAVTRVNDMEVAISTRGTSPALAKRLRVLLELDLDDGGGRFVEELRRHRRSTSVDDT